MKNKLDKVLLYLLTLVVVCQLLFSAQKFFSKPGIAYVDIGKLLQQYKLKSDLEAISGQQLSRIKYTIDSLQTLQKFPGHDVTIDSSVLHAENAFNEYYGLSNQQISKQIWDRLNPLMQSYGKKNGLQLIIGANGTGNVLYGNESMDVTNDLIQYINEMYEKGN